MRKLLQFVRPRTLIRISALTVLLVLCFGLACKHSVVQNPDFALSATPSSVTLTPGGAAQTITFSAAPVNGFTTPVQVVVSGLPTGISAQPASFTLTPGMPQSVSFTAAANASSGSSSITVTAQAGTLTHTAPLTFTIPAQTGTDVTTYHNDNARTGLNSAETILTPANVAAATFGKLMTLQVDGKVDAQPLYLSAVFLQGQTHNVLYVATEHGSLYAFDADTGSQLWNVSTLKSGETTSDDHGCGQITPEIGITGTPLIDRRFGAHGAIFLVAMSKDSSGVYHQRLHAIDVTTGAELSGSPTEIAGSYPGTGDNSSNGKVVFAPGQYAERVGLLLLNGTVYLGWTSHCDIRPYTGWIMGYSETTLQQTSILNVTPNGREGSIWMSGAGPAADSSGNIYFLDANGTLDPTVNASGFPVNNDFGNGIIKLTTANNNLAVADYFEPYNSIAESNADGDLGSGGAMVLPDLTDANGQTRHLLVGAGKDQNIYVADRDNMGKYNSAGNSSLYQELPSAISGTVYSMPAYFNSTIYYAGVGDHLKAFPITNARLASSPSTQSGNTFPFPGSTPAVSANGTSNGIVWALESNISAPAVLHAYDATNLTHELYDSTQASGGRDGFGSGNKYITPLVVNGKVYIGTPNSVVVFGLLATP